jgi:ribosomal protein L3 glutamine methyltransferase
MPRLLQNPTVGGLWRRSSRRLARARLHFGHGTDNARDDAAALICHVMGIRGALSGTVMRRPVTRRKQLRIEALVTRRIRERVPVVYLTQQCWFAGLPMYVDERVLIPRSPLAELIERQFAPWIAAARVRRICDMGTGSGCIAIACAHYLPRARVDAVDISPAALAVARVNIARHRLGKRVRAVKSDHFSALGRSAYDIIVSNPPYVGRREMEGLPAEYRHEPSVALGAGTDGLDSVRVLLKEAPRHLKPGGILVVEVGNTERAVRRAYPGLPFTWLAFERGGGGVFLLTREQLMD